ncbi:EF-hand domain-containing protein [Plasmodiophora brassicae]|uniref:Calmodulin n=1 Tax=Plasmodiophora brassicae TaxID=37360 RepID=A0A0G4IGZ5_PLABS|nr:hypothetical protein PBRA_000258 [Plasmodiophora brassicae]SPQ96820.1 unnamed protein product [Plasmodiophora brassicae]
MAGPDLTEDMKAELREAFQLIDTDKSGSISLDEIEVLLKKFGKPFNKEQLSAMLKSVDENGDGTIDFEEFCGLMIKPATKDMTFEAELREAFIVFDKDGNGLISAQELMSVLINLGEAVTEDEIATMIADADLNGDGQMDWDEFVKVMTY